ncbi:MAG TPA: tRNA preQ1(34) S-adenosylmethionine ribosyltransferase-isomerase QueA [Spirochaetia bacterium]|nr:tRNA preQ1(34) S-adenosylmethionine ribosyltransferase-isomerase QueA [Spirochaetia bacterium]
METNLFSFDLPPELIAQEPTPNREDARLLALDRTTGRTRDARVRELPSLVGPGTVMVVNDTRVRKARLFGKSHTGRSVEILLLAQREATLWETLIGGAGKLRSRSSLSLAEGVSGTVEASDGDIRLVRFDPPIDEAWLERNGHVPLPPYVKRADTPQDEERYQTVYSQAVGSAAAPTAGLHLTERLFGELRSGGVYVCHVTLHVGLGTFLPIRSRHIEEHAMHEEHYFVPQTTKDAVDAAVREHRPVLAVGTTVVRTLETAWSDDGMLAGAGRTRMYVTPGFTFRVVSQLFTNFHTPQSSLLVLVSAFAGRDLILQTYRDAIRKRYRFFSYGDAMLIT